MDNPRAVLWERHGGQMSIEHLLAPTGLLGSGFPLPLDRPFTRAIALAAGMHPRDLSVLVQRGLLRHPHQGVYLAAQAVDDLEQRVRSVGLVMPAGAVVTDRTAAYLHGVDLLPRSALLTPPPISVFSVRESRIRRDGVGSGIRMLAERDVMDIGGLAVSTPLRTCCDLGRLLWRFDALAAIDLYLRHGVPLEELVLESSSARFRGFRWIRQLRTLAPLGDARSESPGESALRLHWLDAGLPAPEPQFWVYDDKGVQVYRLDLTLPGLRYAAEYDGAEHHGVDRTAHDAERREWLRVERGWHIEVFRKDSVYGGRPEPGAVLRSGIVHARATLAPWKLARR